MTARGSLSSNCQVREQIGVKPGRYIIRPSNDKIDKIVGELPDMRKEAVVLIKNAIGHNRRAYVLVNNRLEGNAPLTVQAFTDLLRAEI